MQLSHLGISLLSLPLPRLFVSSPFSHSIEKLSHKLKTWLLLLLLLLVCVITMKNDHKMLPRAVREVSRARNSGEQSAKKGCALSDLNTISTAFARVLKCIWRNLGFMSSCCCCCELVKYLRVQLSYQLSYSAHWPIASPEVDFPRVKSTGQ